MNDLSIDELIGRLKNFPAEDLPGEKAHARMLPIIDGPITRGFRARADARRSSVLLILFPENGKLKLLLTERSADLKSHPAQISFPGGGTEPGELPEETALRETLEEIGLVVGKDDIVCRLSDLYVPPSNSLIVPFVAFIAKPGELKPDPKEVESVFSVALDDLIAPGAFTFIRREISGFDSKAPARHVGKAEPLWGATAMIISELLYMLYGRAPETVDD